MKSRLDLATLSSAGRRSAAGARLRAVLVEPRVDQRHVHRAPRAARAQVERARRPQQRDAGRRHVARQRRLRQHRLHLCSTRAPQSRQALQLVVIVAQAGTRHHPAPYGLALYARGAAAPAPSQLHRLHMIKNRAHPRAARRPPRPRRPARSRGRRRAPTCTTRWGG